MNIIGTIFGKNSDIDHKKLKYGCYDRKFLPSHLNDVSHYQCLLNRGVLNDPVMDDKQHRFCRICIESYLQQTKYCPVDLKDKHKIKKQNLKTDEQSRRLVEILKCKCQNSENGCSYTFCLKDMNQYNQHNSICPKEYIGCTQYGCQSKFFRQDYQTHIESICQYIVVKCPYCDFFSPRHEQRTHKQACKQWPIKCLNIGCQNEIKRKLFTEHMRIFCPFTEIKCPKKRCAMKYLRKEQPQHIKICQYSDQTCIYCKVIYQKYDKNVHLQECSQLPLNCQNQGCSQIIQRRLYKNHVHSNCPWKKIICPSEDCTVQLLLKQKLNHLFVCQDHKIKCDYCPIIIKRKLIPKHLETCPNLPIQCLNENQCKIVVIRNKLQNHMKTECLYQTIKCKYFVDHCQYQCFRKDMGEHEKNCQYRPMPCQLCNIIMPLITIPNHKETVCLQYLIDCTQNCNQQTKRKQLKEHIELYCRQTIVSCDYLQYNCPHKFKRKQTEQHQQKYLKFHHTLILKLTFGLKQESKRMLQNQQKMQSEINQLRNMIGTNNVIINKVYELQRKIDNNVDIVNGKCQKIIDESIKIGDQQRFRGKQIDRMEDYHLQERKQINSLQNSILNVNKSVRESDGAIHSCQNQIRDVKNQVDNIYNKIRFANFN